ncbi:hypothetical protein UB33_02075 [Photobacterium angustum]|nr:hypothetical protein UB39_06775 [Photobacterium angustum]KJG07722.1 hypothetical protein UB33_02075 [Photobacterium angustum]PSV89492.1 hypothetical protein CTN01_17660 [Photobacterium angustum]PSW81249.1 hypothetical protein CTN03_09085 [Photobacterium angustum]
MFRYAIGGLVRNLLFLILLLSVNVHGGESTLFFVDKSRAIVIAESAIAEKYGAFVENYKEPILVQHHFKSPVEQSEHLQVQFTKQESIEQLANGYEKITSNNFTVRMDKSGEVLSVNKGLSLMTSKKK